MEACSCLIGSATGVFASVLASAFARACSFAWTCDSSALFDRFTVEMSINLTTMGSACVLTIGDEYFQLRISAR